MSTVKIIELSDEFNEILLNGDEFIPDLDAFSREDLERARDILDTVLEDRDD